MSLAILQVYKYILFVQTYSKVSIFAMRTVFSEDQTDFHDRLQSGSLQILLFPVTVGLQVATLTTLNLST